METNGKTNNILEKKLEELECLLEEFGLGGDDDLKACHEIQHRLIFMQTLLSTEISLGEEGEEDKSFKLACMAKRLTKVEEAFNKQLSGSIKETGSVSSLQEESPKEDAVVRRNVERIKRKRFRGLVSFGIVGLVAGMVSFYGYIFDQMNENVIVITPT